MYKLWLITIAVLLFFILLNDYLNYKETVRCEKIERIINL